MMVDMNWALMTCRSFVGVFGYMSVYLPRMYYVLYHWLVIVGAAGALCLCVLTFIRRKRVGANSDAILIAAGMLLASAITLGISIYYSWTSDFQAQGRYIIAAAPMVFMAVALGLDQWTAALCAIPAFRQIKRKNLQIFFTVLVVSFVVISVLAGAMVCLETFGYPGTVPAWA
jgi:hypothetical protein